MLVKKATLEKLPVIDLSENKNMKIKSLSPQNPQIQDILYLENIWHVQNMAYSRRPHCWATQALLNKQEKISL